MGFREVMAPGSRVTGQIEDADFSPTARNAQAGNFRHIYPIDYKQFSEVIRQFQPAPTLGRPDKPMSILKKARAFVSHHHRFHGRFNRSLDRLNRLPLLQEFIRRAPRVPTFETREAMWDHLARRGASSIDFLEFGVHQGHSILYWTSIDNHPDSRFVGFDTFQGLPEEWNRAHPIGHFDMKGEVPQTSDPRVTFVKGLFQETLDRFLSTYVPRSDQRVIHIDCDLYSSTLYCLTKLDALFVPGTIIIFDEFGDVQHEFRAFSDYLSSYRRKAQLIAAHDDFFTVAVEIA